MNKRPGSPTVQPIKLLKLDNEWTISPTGASPTSDLQDATRPILPEPAIVRPLRCKRQILQSYILNYNPLVVATINLCGVYPEVRLVSPDSAFTLTADEFNYLAGRWDECPIFLRTLNVEPNQDGRRFVRYSKDMSHEFLPLTIFDMDKVAVLRLKLKMAVMCAHLENIQGCQPSINHMFRCIVDIFKREYVRMNTIEPISDVTEQLSHAVETHVPASTIVKNFSLSSGPCLLNAYSLYSSCMAQKKYLYSLL